MCVYYIYIYIYLLIILVISSLTHELFRIALFNFQIFEVFPRYISVIDLNVSFSVELEHQFSRSVVSNSLRPHEPQHARPPCPSPTPRVHPNPCPLSQWCHPTISSSVINLLLLPSIFPSNRVFSNESALHIRGPKYWSISFNISPTNEHPGPISFRIDWLDLFAVQGTLKSLLQHHNSKASILWHSAFFTVQLSHPYMTTGKTIALTRRTFVGKVMSLLLHVLSRLVITFLPSSMLSHFSRVRLCATP